MQFSDYQQITELRYNYAYGIDMRNWALHRSVFTTDIRMDFSSYNGEPASTMPADEWVDSIKPLFSGLAATHHQMTNPVVQVDDERAKMSMYMQAQHVLIHEGKQTTYLIGGYYVDELIKQADEWLISSVTLNVLYSEGDPQIMATAAQIGAEKLL